MCGIVGFVGHGSRDDLKRMTDALAHRGPNGEGYHCDDEFAVHLGHRRLAIIDIAGGAQPMWNEDGRVCVIFNGEIYNHMELRAELIRAGHVFQSTHSDTEVLVHGYEEWGEELPIRLNGMFAFAIWDRRRKRLFLARDRFGEKPLFYAKLKDGFAFASELPALLLHPDVRSQLSTRSLQKLFAYGFIPAPLTLYEGTHKLPGGHFLTYDLDEDAAAARTYWRFEIEPDETMCRRSEEALAEELRELFFQAVRRRLISDVPLGIFLSGGLDSSATLASAVRQVPNAAVKSFTIGFTEASFDESGYARSVAAALGSEHREKIIDLATAEALIPNVLSRLSEPLGDASILPTYLLCDFTRQHVTVALSGSGGDELFAGYDPFQALDWARRYARYVPAAVHAGVRRLVDLLPSSARNMSLEFKAKRALRGLSYPAPMWNPIWMSPLEPAEMADLFMMPVCAEDVYEEAISLWNRNPKADLVDRTLEYFTSLYLQDDILVKEDSAAMMVSLESRAVFLDNDLVEFSRRLPNRFKFRNGKRKYLFKKAFDGILPQETLARAKKGFGIPLADWLRRMSAPLSLSPIDGINMGWAQQQWESHRGGRSDQRFFLWNCLSLQYVMSRHAQGQALGGG